MKPAMQYCTLMLLAALALTACAPKQAADNTDAQKPAKTQARPLSEMDTQFLYLAAQNALKDGNPALAIQLLETLSKKDPAAIMPRQQLIELLLHRAKFDKATAHIDLLIQNKDLNPEQLAQIRLLQARAQAGAKHSDEALATLDLILKQKPANIPARDLQVRILSSQKRIDEALVAIDQAIQAKDAAEFRLLQAQLFINKGDTDAAKSSLHRLQQLAPDNNTAALMLSSIAIREKKLELAEKVLRDFLDGHANSLPVSHALGRLLAQQNRLAEAILIYRKIAKQTDNDPAVLRTMGLLYLQFNEYKLAEETFRTLFEDQPNDSNRFYLAASLEALERDDEAREIYAGIDKKSPLFADAQMRLAGMDFRQDAVHAAAKRVKRILEGDPEHLEAHLLLSAIRISQKKYRLLLDESQSLLALPKLAPQLLLNRAVAFDHFKEYAQAQTMLTRILTRHPKHAEALNFLGYIYAEQGIELQQAETLIKRALVHKPDDGYYMDSLAWVYYKNGDYAKALSMQKKALEIISDDAVMHEHIGDIWWRTGDKQAARQAWQKSIELKAENTGQLKRKIAKGLKNSE